MMSAADQLASVREETARNLSILVGKHISSLSSLIIAR